MKSPFPGMDPWLESRWGDVHTRLCMYSCDELQRQLPAGLKARVEEYLSVDDQSGDGEDEERRPRFVPDVHIVERGPWTPDIGIASNVAVAEPLLLENDPEAEQVELRYIKIIDTRHGNRVVTAIEFLSPTNKTSNVGRGIFRSKQKMLAGGGANIVEIDLLRVGSWTLSAPERRVPSNPRAPYHVCIQRNDSLQVELYPISLRTPLPAIRIPLRESDADVVLELQRVFEMAYVNGAYGDDIDYRVEPDPPLEGADRAWADELLKSQGRR